MNISPIPKYFYELGQEVDKNWQQFNYNEEYFPDIAYDSLSRRHLKNEMSYQDILTYIALNYDLDTFQTDSNFGDIQIILYKGPKFYIEALFWMNGTTTIHQHSFCGAFSLLHGKSINTEFQFIKKTRINSHCYLGDLNFKENLILIPGMVRKILPGNNLIHSIFHVDAPSITIVIRNNVCADHKPQLDYYSPHIAIDGWYKDKAFDRRIQCIQLMLQDAKEHAHQILETFIVQANLHQIFMLFKKIRLYQFEPDYIDKISDLIIKKAGGDLFLKTINEQYKYQRLISLRQLVKDKDQRIILAVLRTTPGKKNIINNFLQLLNIQDEADLIKILGQFINQTSTMGAIGYSYCHDAEKIAEIMLKDYTESEMSEEVSKLDNSAKNCYTGLKKSFIFQNWFTPSAHTND